MDFSAAKWTIGLNFVKTDKDKWGSWEAKRWIYDKKAKRHVSIKRDLIKNTTSPKSHEMILLRNSNNDKKYLFKWMKADEYYMPSYSEWQYDLDCMLWGLTCLMATMATMATPAIARTSSLSGSKKILLVATLAGVLPRLGIGEHQHQHNPLVTGCLLFKSWEIMIFQSTFKVISFFWMLKEQAPHKIYCQSKTWWRETYLKPALESTSVSIALWYYIGADQHLICINNIENENGRELFCSTQVCNCVSSLHFAEFCLSN